jgi:hypothetical protein
VVELDELSLDPSIVDLAASVSIAAVVDPALLRIARRRLHPDLTHEAEAVIFHSPLAESRGRHGFVLAEAYLPELRLRLVDSGRLSAARAVVEKVHAGSPELLRLDERLTYELLTDADACTIDGILGSVVAWLRDADDRRPVSRWIMRVFRRAPEQLWSDPRFATRVFSLVQAASAVLGATPPARVAAGFGPTLPVFDDRTMPIGVRLGPAGLVVAGDALGSVTIPVPAAWPVVLSVAASNGASTPVVLHEPASVATAAMSAPVTITTTTGRRFRVSQAPAQTGSVVGSVAALSWLAEPACVVAATTEPPRAATLAPDSLRLVDEHDMEARLADRVALAGNVPRLVITYGGDVEAWDLNESKVLGQFSAEGRVHALAISGNGELVVAATAAATYGWRSGHGPAFALPPQPGPLTLSTDGYVLAIADVDHTVKRWDAMRGTALSTVEVKPPVSALALGPYGSQLAVGAITGEVLLFPVDTPDPLRFEADTVDSIDALAFGPGGALLASGDRAGVVRIWDPAQPDRPVLAMTGSRAGISALAWSPDGARLVAGSVDGSLRIWDVTRAPATPHPPVELSPGRIALLAAYGAINPKLRHEL